MGNNSSVELRARAQRKRADRDAKHAKLADICNTHDIPADTQERILNATVTELLIMMDAREVTSETIVKVYCGRCHRVGYGLNNVTEEAYDEAIAAAQRSDAKRAAGEPCGLLEGVPVSIKHHINQTGFDSDCGTAVRCGRPATADALVVTLLRDAGAIPFVRSQIPQCLMVPESDNFIWGRSINPYDAGRTTGGSSGGEGGLVASRCSPIGIGTDIGGSIRIPAHFCGVFGFKPTPDRTSGMGIVAPRPGDVDGQHAILATAGPMGRCTDDLVLVLRSWWNDKHFTVDPTVPPIPFRMPIYSGLTTASPTQSASPIELGPKRLRVGIFRGMRFFEPATACVRAVDEAADALRAAGHEVVEWNPETVGLDLYRASLLYYALMAVDGKLRAFKSGLEGEELHPMYDTLNSISSLPGWVRGIVAWFLRTSNKPRMADLLATAIPRDALGLWNLHAEQLQFTNRFIAEWRARELDIVLCPGLGLPALQHGGSKELTVACCYTFLWNLLHFPAGTVPVSKVRADEAHYNAPAEQHDDFYHAAVACMQNSAGLPVSVQVVGLPHQDELCLYGMKQLETALKSRDAAWSATAPEAVVMQSLEQVRAAGAP